MLKKVICVSRVQSRITIFFFLQIKKKFDSYLFTVFVQKNLITRI